MFITCADTGSREPWCHENPALVSKSSISGGTSPTFPVSAKASNLHQTLTQGQRGFIGLLITFCLSRHQGRATVIPHLLLQHAHIQQQVQQEKSQLPVIRSSSLPWFSAEFHSQHGTNGQHGQSSSSLICPFASPPWARAAYVWPAKLRLLNYFTQ